MGKGARVRAGRSERDARRAAFAAVCPPVRFVPLALIRARAMSYDHTDPGAYLRKGRRVGVR